MSCQERAISLFFSLLLAGEGFADDCALPRWLSFPARRGRRSPRRLCEGMRTSILQLVRCAVSNDHNLCEKFCDAADSRRSSFRCAECSNQEDAWTRFPVAKLQVLLSRY